MEFVMFIALPGLAAVATVLGSLIWLALGVWRLGTIWRATFTARLAAR